mgnify:CR=1 FL=1
MRKVFADAESGRRAVRRDHRAALAAGVASTSVARGLAAFVPVAGRSHAQDLWLGKRRITLVDDTYNANPDSVRAAIDVLAQLPGPHLLVLGDMGEVGTQGPEFHAEVGRYAQERGIEYVLTHGKLSEITTQSHSQAQHFDQIEALCAGVDRMCPKIESVLVKGSRFMRMERVVRHLTDSQREAATC